MRIEEFWVAFWPHTDRIVEGTNSDSADGCWDVLFFLMGDLRDRYKYLNLSEQGFKVKKVIALVE